MQVVLEVGCTLLKWVGLIDKRQHEKKRKTFMEEGNKWDF